MLTFPAKIKSPYFTGDLIHLVLEDDNDPNGIIVHWSTPRGPKVSYYPKSYMTALLVTGEWVLKENEV